MQDVTLNDTPYLLIYVQHCQGKAIVLGIWNRTWSKYLPSRSKNKTMQPSNSVMVFCDNQHMLTLENPSLLGICWKFTCFCVCVRERRGEETETVPWSSGFRSLERVDKGQECEDGFCTLEMFRWSLNDPIHLEFWRYASTVYVRTDRLKPNW